MKFKYLKLSSIWNQTEMDMYETLVINFGLVCQKTKKRVWSYISLCNSVALVLDKFVMGAFYFDIWLFSEFFCITPTIFTVSIIFAQF